MSTISIRIGQGRLLSTPWRLLATAISVGAIIGSLEVISPGQNIELIPVLILCTLVPAYWTSRKVIAVSASSHEATSYWWIMGRKFREQTLGVVTAVKVSGSSEPSYCSLLLLTKDGADIPVIQSISEDQLTPILQRFGVAGIPVDSA